MTRQVSDKADPTIEDFRAQFETWRNARKCRKPIPVQLLQAAVDLSKNYSFHKIEKPYPKRTDNDLPIIKEISLAFIELDFSSSPTAACECTLDIKGSDGDQMKMLRSHH